MICPYCQLDKRQGHAEDCILRPNPFTPGEMASLKAVARRITDWDTSPFRYRDGRLVPWDVLI